MIANVCICYPASAGFIEFAAGFILRWPRVHCMSRMVFHPATLTHLVYPIRLQPGLLNLPQGLSCGITPNN
ncbi:MAG: hypothetical protein R3E39_12305 [Anaerolineae bacterium]